MEYLPYGVAVARRGWCEKKYILNTLNYEEFKRWLEKVRRGGE
jgi:DNA polymerase (family 10)